MESGSRAVLITGCSTGIGRATAELLVDRGWIVYATARRPESIDDLAARGARTLALDVDDPDSIEAAVAAVEDAEGSVGALVNNAGFGLHGAIETTPIDDVRRQFETNLFGLFRLTQRVLPGMRDRQWGRIVNVSSMGGKIEFPGGGFYHATKHALEAYSDVLRYELKPFGIDVVIIEPGLIKTQFGETAVTSVEPADDDSPYGSFNTGLQARIAGAYEGPMARFAAPPERVARAIQKALAARRPRTRYPVTVSGRLIVGLRAVLPDRAWDAVMRRQYPSPQSVRK